MGQNLRSEKLSFDSVHTYLVGGCGENIDSGEKKMKSVEKWGREANFCDFLLRACPRVKI